MTCGAEGVALAGVPLLHKTVAGFEPRSIVEIQTLMREAYGFDPASSARLRSGLNVVAMALNDGDIGRAMVAAVHLRLSELSSGGGARLAQANQALVKYDPNEPRDAHGRWTSGGEPPTANIPHPSHRHQTVRGDARHQGRGRPQRRSADGSLKHPLNLRPVEMKPILVSDPGGPSGLAPISSSIVNMTLSRECVKHAREPNYYKKTQDCTAVMQQCEWLLSINGENSLRRDACLWPDGAAAMMKLGILVPFKLGHPF
jgi:hypothetical protein